jgi:hypothetical protein
MPENQISQTPVSGDESAASLAGFHQYVNDLKQTAKRQYDRNINKDLSSQNWQNLFKRNVVAVLQQVYEASLVQLGTLHFGTEKMESEDGFSPIAIQALKPFDGVVDDIIQYALQKHRTSCALSNFPDEHNPSEDYIAEVIQETGRDWQAFASQVNALAN